MMLHGSPRRLIAAMFGAFAATAQGALGQTTYTFVTQSEPTTFVDWHDPTVWSPSGVPNASGDGAIINRPPVVPNTAFSILADQDTTIGSLTVDSTGLTQTGLFTIDGSGTLIFQSPSGPATFTGTAAQADAGGNQAQSIVVWNNISLLSDLVITHDLRPAVNATNLINGVVTGANDLTITKEGSASIQFSHHGASGFAGQYVINNGGIRVTGSSNFAQSSGVTVNAGGQLQLNAASGGAEFHDWALADGAVLNLNGPGRTGLQGSLRFQGQAGQEARHSKFHSPVVLQTNATIGIGPVEVTGELTNVVSGSGGLVKNGPGKLVLSNPGNSYAGNTTIQNGGGTLSISHPVLSNDADVLFATNSSFLELNFLGADAIRSLFIGGEQQVGGLWGAIGNLAADFTTERIIGSGLLEVLIGPGPLGLPGDFNKDGVVNAADYTVWRDNWGSDNPLGGNGDEDGASAGIVDQADYVLWQSNYGSTAPASGLAVPEPNTLLLVLSGTAVVWGGRRGGPRTRLL